MYRPRSRHEPYQFIIIIKFFSNLIVTSLLHMKLGFPPPNF